MTKYLIAPAARQDLLDIIDYVWRENPVAAARVHNALFEAFEILAEQPAIGHFRHDLTNQPVRFWTVLRRYSIVYRGSGGNSIEVVRILGPGRNAATLLK